MSKKNYHLLTDSLISEIAAGDPKEWLILEPHPDFQGQWIVECLNSAFIFDFKELIGSYRALAPSQLEEFLDLAAELGYQVAFGEDPLGILDAYEHLSDPPPFSIESTLPGTVNGFLPYQVQGFNFLKDVDGGVAMWSTGTGKTVLASALIKHHLEMGSVDIVWFVVKSHNKINTQRSLLGLTHVDSVVLDGVKKRRHEILRGLVDAPTGTVVVTNYEKFRVDQELILPLFEGKRVLCVWDEMPTKLKTRNTQLYQAVRKCLYKGQHCKWEYRRPKVLKQLMLSATPIENSPEDFYNCLRLLDPRVYGSVEDFYNEYVRSFSFFDANTPANWHHLDRMGLKAAHITHQVDKTDPDIAKQFPNVLDENLFIDWSDKDHVTYDKLRKLAKKEIEISEMEESSILALIGVMQMMCDAPSMITNSAALREVYELAAAEFGETPAKQGSEVAMKLVRSLGKELTDATHTKLDTLHTLLTETHKDEKVVIFSAFNDALLPILGSHLKSWGIKYVTYNGSNKNKQISQDKFLNDNSVQVFLSSDAGSDSINLQCASVVIHYDLPWKFSTMIQRQNRIHRVTSTFDKVKFYRLLMANSVEERKLKIIGQKEAFHNQVFKGAIADQATSARMSKEDLMYVLGF